MNGVVNIDSESRISSPGVIYGVVVWMDETFLRDSKLEVGE
jgi:hypothetical protein